MCNAQVTIETFGTTAGANTLVQLVLPGAYKYRGFKYQYSPMLLSVSPRAASAEEPITITGNNLGFWVQVNRLATYGEYRPVTSYQGPN